MKDDKTTDPAQALVLELKGLVAALPIDEERVIPRHYAVRIKAVGDVPFLLALFRTYSDNQLGSWMFLLAFYWKDLPYQTWQGFLREISADAVLLYQFVFIASEFLGIDARAMIRSDPSLSDVAREFTEHEFLRGVPKSETAWFVEMCEERGIDYWTIWSRLAAEGAPMNVDMSAGPRR